IDYRLIVEAITDIEIVLLDRQGNVRAWNKGAEMLRGQSEEEMLGRSASGLYPEGERGGNPLERELAEAERTGRFEGEAWQLGKQGRRFLASIVVQPVRTRAGALEGYLRTIRD